MTRIRILSLACLLTILAGTGADAYHASCAGGQVPPNDRCNNTTAVKVGNPGSGGWLICESNNPSQGEVQYDWTTIFAGRSRYVCTHYHSCSEVQGVHPGAYADFCD
ncbi:MAG: hypothetical protein AAF899_13110 [Pseudomonadota bacterium]